MTPGEQAYAKALETAPIYHDGKPRRKWHELPQYLRDNWEQVEAREERPIRGPIVEALERSALAHKAGEIITVNFKDRTFTTTGPGGRRERSYEFDGAFLTVFGSSVRA